MLLYNLKLCRLIHSQFLKITFPMFVRAPEKTGTNCQWQLCRGNPDQSRGWQLVVASTGASHLADLANSNVFKETKKMLYRKYTQPPNWADMPAYRSCRAFPFHLVKQEDNAPFLCSHWKIPLFLSSSCFSTAHLHHETSENLVRLKREKGHSRIGPVI